MTSVQKFLPFLPISVDESERCGPPLDFGSIAARAILSDLSFAYERVKRMSYMALPKNSVRTYLPLNTGSCNHFARAVVHSTTTYSFDNDFLDSAAIFYYPGVGEAGYAT